MGVGQRLLDVKSYERVIRDEVGRVTGGRKSDE